MERPLFACAINSNSKGIPMDRKINSLNIQLNAAVLTLSSKVLSSGYKTMSDEFVPDNYEHALYSYYQRNGMIVINRAPDDDNIFGDAGVYEAFNAWVRYRYVFAEQKFTEQGARHVFKLLCMDILDEYGINIETCTWMRIIEAELLGVIRYMNYYGHAPVDRVEFVRSYMDNKSAFLTREF